MRTPPRVPFQTRTRAQAAAEAAAVEANIFDIITPENAGILNLANSNEIVNLANSSDNSRPGSGDFHLETMTSALRTTPVASSPPRIVETPLISGPSASETSQPAMHEILLQLNEARTQLDYYKIRLDQIEADRNTERDNFLAELRLRDGEAAKRQQIIDKLQEEQLSLRGQLVLFDHRLNQMSSIPSIIQTTPTMNTINTDIPQVRLAGGNTSTVTPVELGLGYNLKPDTYDGTAPLHEYLNQFNLIARANNWNDEKKMVALAASLRGKAKGVLSSYTNTEFLDLRSLLEKLEARFGEHFGSSSYSLFQNRRQRLGEDLPTLAADIERLAGLAYAECSQEVRDKIACSQFIGGIYNISVRETLQLERITSLKVALARALEVKGIKEKNRNLNTQQNTKSYQNIKNSSNTAPISSTHDVKQDRSFNHQEWLKDLECWGCHKKGHTQSRCPRKGN